MRPDEVWGLTANEISRYAQAVAGETEARAMNNAFLAALSFNDPKQLSRMQKQREAARLAAKPSGVIPAQNLLDTLRALGVTREPPKEE